LAFDFGLRRIGLASGNRLTGTAQEIGGFTGNQRQTMQQVLASIAEWQPDALVVGVPFHPDGGEHENTLRARRFARQLHGRTGLTVFEVDERYSTTEAIARGAMDHDASAARIILEQFLGGLS